MLLRTVKLSNFGTYGDSYTFDLAPVVSGRFDRPIILFRGKNGVGKTTLVEAIRIGLHGSLALGGRVSRREYEEYLASRIHRNTTRGEAPISSTIELIFDHITSGQGATYHVKRSWHRTNGNGIVETLSVLENDRPPSDLDSDQVETFLRELIPENIIRLFFFDGEKLETLSKDSSASLTLAESIKSLLGLNLVEQLQKDLDIYISRQTARYGTSYLLVRLEELNQQKSELGEERQLTLSEQKKISSEQDRQEKIIKEQEQKIASEGGWFASKLDELRQSRQRLLVEIDVQRRYVQELCNGLVPFSIAPEMCRAVVAQLELERDYEQQLISNELLERQANRISEELGSSDFWQSLNLEVDDQVKTEALNRLESVLRESLPKLDLNETQVVMHVSERDRRTLLTWITQALDDIPRQFCSAIQDLNQLEQQYEAVENDLSLVPPDETLSPLVEGLHDSYRQLGELQNKSKELEELARSQDYELEQLGYELSRIHQQLAEQERSNNRVQLAAKTQLAFNEYSRVLVHQKIKALEEALVTRFNDLCRKEYLLDEVSIDPTTFFVTLRRNNQDFDRTQLSAGEKQLFAIATMWALREASGLPLPVVIDTPLGRLDSEHRLSMTQSYFPRASHQVILLATDVEIDNHLLPTFADYVSHIYDLEFDEEQGKTIAAVSYSEDGQFLPSFAANKESER